MKAVGNSVARKDGIGKATGGAKYADDLTFPGMIHGRTIRSTIPRGKVKSIKYDFDTTGFTIVDYRDIPSKNIVDLIEQDQPFLVETEVRHMAEPIVLLAHADREKLNAAKVIIEYEEETPLFDPEKSTHSFKNIDIVKGDVAKALAGADVVIEGTYRTGHQEHVYIEPNGLIAVPEENGFALYGSMQCPFYVIKALRCLMGSAHPNIRVVQTETGGGFGGKEEYPSMIGGHALLLAMKSGVPVKIIYDRVEDMIATTKRHPAIVKHRTGLRKDGTLVAMDIEVILDGGAYVTLTPTVLSRGCIHAAGPYRCDNIRIQGRGVFTNTPPNGAFRGFGAPQTEFAVEVHMERIAEQMGLDPVELRRKNALRAGDKTATGQTLRDDTSALMVLEEAVRRTDFTRKRKEYKGTNKAIGMALFFHGAGFTGAGERNLKSKARIDLTETGVRIAVGSTEIGQGTRTMHAQIVTDALGIPYESVEVAQPDTSKVADSGPTVASRTCMVVGKILEECAEEMKQKLGGMAPAEYYKKNGPFSVERMYEPPAWITWDDKTYLGDAYATYGWGCNVMELELDPVTFEVKPIKMTAVQEFGRPIHPALARGQIEGGTAQGLGYDVAIVGGGPAGLTAGLWLARYLHKVVLIDSGDPRNWETRGVNGFLGESGIKPSQLRGYGRAECEKYGVELVDDTVDEATNRNGDLFTLKLKSGRCIDARRVLLAIGIKDVWPDIEGLDRCYGETVHVCPDCDGYESRGRKVVIVGKSRKAVGMALALTTWTDKIVICTNGEPGEITDEQCDQLGKLNIPVIEAKIRRLESNGTEIRSVELEGDMHLDCDSLFFAIGQYPADDLGAQLKCERDEFGLIVVDDRYHTSVKNVYAAGDIVPGPQLAIAAASDGAIAALAIHHSLIPEERLLK